MSSAIVSSVKQIEKKFLLRKEMKLKLKEIKSNSLNLSNIKILDRLFSFEPYLCNDSFSAYLSMPNEINTINIIENIFNRNKRVYIPKVIGKNCNDMIMYELKSLDEINTFPKSKWEIPEPTLEMIEIREKENSSKQISCVIVPGVAFDSNCCRLGHGKGYYDYFLSNLIEENIAKGYSPPITIALAYDEQILENGIIPMIDNQDKYVDYVITPNFIYSRI
jgi:5-formyltetrahydrofolate cyclo-ligase